MTYDQDQLNEAQIALERAEDRIWVLEQQVRERDALLSNYERLLRHGVVFVVFVALVGAAVVIWKLLD